MKKIYLAMLSLMIAVGASAGEKDEYFRFEAGFLFNITPTNWNCQPTSGSSDHFVEFVAVVSFGNVFEFASEQIAVLLEERNVPVTRIRHDH